MADIPINPVTRRVQFTGNTGTGPFAFTFNILTNTDIVVYKNTTLLTLTTDYTVSINANGTGSVSLTGSGSGTALISSDVLTIIGGRELSRTTDFVTAGDLLASSLNEQLDSDVIMVQQLDEKFDRTLRFDSFDVYGSAIMPAKADRLGKYLQFNATTGNPEAGPDSTDVTTLADIATDIATLADIEDGTEGTDTIQTVAGISGNVTTVAGISSNVTAVAGNASNINIVAADGTDIGTVSTNIANVNTVAGISANVTSVVNNATNINAVAADETDIGTVATNIANVNTVAGINANVTSVAGNATNINTVAADGTDIGTVSASIADVNTCASNITAIQDAPDEASAAAASAAAALVSENNASTSASTASTAATDAQTAQTAAELAETNAGNSETAASNSASAADAAKDAALAALDSFDDRYLGTKTSDPTLDNDGNALVAGALYFNTTDNVMKVYEGSSWVAAYASLSGALLTANNLSDLASASAARTNLGLGTAATTAATDYLQNLVEDTTPQLGGDLDTNGNDVNFGDGDKALFGAGNDLQIYHDGSHSIILDNGTGDLYIRASDNFNLQVGNGAGGWQDAIRTYDANRVDISYAGSVKLATTATGVDVTGTVTADGLTVSNTGESSILINADTNNDAGEESGFLEIRTDNEAVRHRVEGAGSGNNLEIIAGSTGTTTAGIVSNIIFKTKDTGASATERMRIDPTGNVGIGTTSPSTALEVNGTITATTVDLGDWTITESAGVLYFATSGTNKMKLDASGNLTVTGDVTAYGTI